MLHLGVPRFSLQLSFCLAEKVFVISKVLLPPCLCSRSHCSEMDPVFSLTAALKALVLTSLYAILGMGSCTNSGLGRPPLWPRAEADPSLIFLISSFRWWFCPRVAGLKASKSFANGDLRIIYPVSFVIGWI